MKKVLLLLVVVAVGAGAFVGYKKVNAKEPEGLAVDAAPVGRMTIVQTVTATGQIQPRTQVNISADVSAKITRLEVAEGDWVERGQFLLELDRERLAASVEVAEANLRSSTSNVNLARENVIKAEKDYDRVKGLFDGELESQAALDGAYAGAQAEKARYQSSLETVQQVRAQLKQTRDSLSKTRIYAPLSGTVSKLNKEAGEIALGSQFQEDVIMVISNLAGMEALVDVDENDIVNVTSGDAAKVEVDALTDVILEGNVTDIANSAKQSGSGSANQKTEFVVKVALTDQHASLRPGMTASADIVTDTKEGVFGVPIQSVAVRTMEQLKGGLEEGDKEALDSLEPDKEGFVEMVFVVADGVASVRQVKTGVQSDSHIEILEGLGEGDVVVTGNYRAISKDLEHGCKVEVTMEKKEEAPLVATNTVE